MVLYYEISPYPGLVGQDLVVRIYEAQNDSPSGLVHEETIPEKDITGTPTPGAGHQVINTVMVNGLDKVVHIVRLYTSVTNQKLHEYNTPPETDTVTVFTPIRFKIGDGNPLTPAANTDVYVNPLLIGLLDDEYSVFRNYYGYLFPQLHYTTDPVTGSFQLINPDIFNDGEEFIIKREPKALTSPVNDSVVAKYFKGFLDINADLVFDPSHLRYYMRFNGAFVYTFDTDPAIGYGFVFTRYGGAGDAVVKFNNAPLIWGDATKAEITLPRYTNACFSFDGVNWNVVWMASSLFSEAVGVPPGTVVNAGVFPIGDVAPGDPIYLVNHGSAIAGDYMVQLSIKSNVAATYHRNNKICSTWWHHATDKPNKFYFSLQEISGEVQDLSVSWVIIKL